MAIDKQPTLILQTSPDWQDYELLDSGDGLKLERYGKYVFKRPEPEAIWRPALAEKAWKNIDAVFRPSPEENGGHWETLRQVDERWMMRYKGLKFWTQLSASRHLGVFPEQAAQWDWITAQVSASQVSAGQVSASQGSASQGSASQVRAGSSAEASSPAAGRSLQVLNLFGYTGLATLAAAAAGARVTHVDASKKVITWARENQELSGLAERPIRWIVDDALKFIERDARRGTRYDGLILDPPKFGRGPKGEVWEFYKLLPNLLAACREVLTERPRFVLLTAYAVKASALTLYYAIDEVMRGIPGHTEAGEVILQEKSAGRLLSMAIFGRWKA